MAKKTPFYDLHLVANGKMVDFAGWLMPLHYGSQLDEHHQVRQAVGVFDVSHMGVVDVTGHEAADYLRYLLANNIDKLQNGGALYSCMLNESGGVLDDLIVYRIEENVYRIVINAGTREKDLAWMRMQAVPFQVTLTERNDLAMLAIQGPLAAEKITALLPAADIEKVKVLKPFTFTTVGDSFIARTGYTGEDGFEWIIPSAMAESVWRAILAVNIKPCGLGARDTLRLEAGYNLYGADMNETVTPLESNLAWTVSFEPADRNFIGRAALIKQKENGVKQILCGLILEGAGIIRNHQSVLLGDQLGEVTSGGYSPTLQKSIALARVPLLTLTVGEPCQVEIRHKLIPARMVKPAFVRQGKILV